MSTELSFKKLPFNPVEGQVIYVEGTYHEELNTFFESRYEWLKKMFLQQGLEFCYLPLLSEEIIAYNAPYISDAERATKSSGLPKLAEYAVNPEEIKPCFVFALDIPIEDPDGNTVLQCLAIDLSGRSPSEALFNDLAYKIRHLLRQQSDYYHNKDSNDTEGNRWKRYYNHEVRYSSRNLHEESEVFDEARFDYRKTTAQGFAPYVGGYDARTGFGSDDYNKAETDFDEQSQLILDEIRERIDVLRNRGVNTMILHTIIDEGVKLSRLKVTKDFRIFLVDYNNTEITLAVLPKAVFLLFLRHPEGIRFKELSDHYSELLNIYKQMNPIGGRLRQEQSIRDVTDPCKNSINEKCARIREAFVSHFDERFAQNYFVTGGRGEAKRIKLSRDMIIWE